MAVTGETTPAGSEVDRSVVTAVVGAYYPHLVSSADAARTRAQSAYAIANALAGGLVGASLFTVFANAPTATVVLGAVAVGLWILSAGLYVRAIASPLHELQGNAADGSAFVDDVLAKVRTERKEVDDRQRAANFGAMAAVAVTAISFGLLLFGGSATFRGTVDLTAAGQRALSASCGRPVTSLTGDIEKASLGRAFVVVGVPEGFCRGATEIRVPASDVADVRS